jgi:hypothetical protein
MINDVQNTPLAIYRGKPSAIVLRNLVVGVGYEAWGATLKFRSIVKGATLFELSVGQGITLSTHDGVANAMATILPTAVQSALVPKGTFASWELVEGNPETVVMRGTLTGQESAP